MKAKEPHRVPLPEVATALVQTLKEQRLHDSLWHFHRHVRKY